MKPRGSQWEQLRLFDAPPSRSPHPGDLGFEDWSKRSDVFHHGTYRSDWDENDFPHFGSVEAASTALLGKGGGYLSDMRTYSKDQARSYLYGEDRHEIPNQSWQELRSQFEPGRIFSRRIPDVEYDSETGQPYSDAVANAAHWRAHNELAMGGFATGHLSTSVADSSGGIEADDEEAIGEAHLHLEMDRPIGYTNNFEHEGSLSVVAPKGTPISYLDDVQRSNRSDAQKAFARTLQDRAAGLDEPRIGIPVEVARQPTITYTDTEPTLDRHGTPTTKEVQRRLPGVERSIKEPRMETKIPHIRAI